MSDEPGSRNERFVRAAKRLLTFQAIAAAGAVLVTGWAMVEVNDVVRERDALAARVAELEGRAVGTAPAPIPVDLEGLLPGIDPAAQNGVAPLPDGNGMGPDGGQEETPQTFCLLLANRTPSECPLPLQRVNPQVCLDVAGRRAHCPDVPLPPAEEPGNPPPPPAGSGTPATGGETPRPAEPGPRATNGFAAEVRPPPSGVCVDANNRQVRCPNQ